MVHLEVELSGSDDLPRRVRKVVDDLGGLVDIRRLGDVRLLVHELVANSVRHGRTGKRDWIVLSFDASTERIRVEVVDSGSGFEPVVREPRLGQTSGMGLYFVDTLADRWGVDGSADSSPTCTWFEIDLARREPDPPETPVH